MSFLSKLLGRSKSKKVEADKFAEKKESVGVSGTVIRPDTSTETKEKPKTLLEIAEVGDWDVKQVVAYEIGDVIDGQYKVEKVFSGGMGYVYIAKSENQNIRFAIKQPNEMMLANKSFFGRVLREADAWTGLGMHPHIAYCYFVKKIEGVPYIFIEYVDGDNLREWIADGRCSDFKTGLEMCIQFCHGMEHAHNKGMMHRDIKPENVLTAKDGTVKVTDFGLAGEVEKGEGRLGKALGGGDLTRIGDVMGTEGYMSPEQWENPREVGPESDIFSFGVCMWEMFCGRRPYKVSIGDVGSPPDTQKLRPDIPDDLSRILCKSTDLDKNKRHTNFTELREELNDLYKGLYSEDAFSYRIDIPDSLAGEWCNRGYSYYQLGDEKRAAECWDKALEADPHHPEATYNRGLLFWRSGRMTEDVLVKQLEEVRTSHEGDWRDEYYLGLVHMERGDAESAIKVLEEAFNEAPEEEDLQRALTKAQSGYRRWHSYRKTFEGDMGCFSHDGRWVLSSDLITYHDRKGYTPVSYYHLRLWELDTGRCVRTFEKHNGKISSINISPDGRWGLSGSSDKKTLQLWELDTGRCVRTLEGHTMQVNSVSISPDGRMALSGSWDKTLRLWELSTGRCVRIFKGASMVNSVSISPDSLWGLSGSIDKTIRLWELSTGRCVRTFEGHTSPVNSVSISSDGRWVLSGSNTLKLWELDTGRCIRTFKGHTSIVNSVRFSPDGCWGLSGSIDKTLRLWELSTGRCLRTFEGHTSTVNSVSISPDGRMALSGSRDKTIRLWRIGDIGPAGVFAIAYPRSVSEVQKQANIVNEAIENARAAIEQGLVTIAAAEVSRVRELQEYERHPILLELWDELGQRGRLSGFLGGWLLRQFDGVKGGGLLVNISPDGRWALSSDFITHTDILKYTPVSYYHLRLWELDTGRCVRTFEKHSGEVSSVSISPDGRWGLSGSRDKNTLQLWELDTGRCVRTFKGHTSMVLSVSISPDGRWGLSGSGDQTLRLWELDTGQCVRTFKGHTVGVLSVSFSPDGRWGLSGSGDQTLRLWEVDTGRCIRTFEKHRGRVRSVSFSPDGRWGLSGSGDQTLRLWELSTGRCLRTFKGHTSTVISVSFSPDGRWGLSGSHDKTVKLWELDTGRCARTFEGHTGKVHSLSLSPDGRLVLSMGEFKELILWKLVWNYEFPEPSDWDEGARPYLDTFLTLHCPYSEDGISHVGKPSWVDDDFKKLIKELRYRGYGWLHPEGIRKELEKMTKQWKGPPNLYE